MQLLQKMVWNSLQEGEDIQLEDTISNMYFPRVGKETNVNTGQKFVDSHPHTGVSYKLLQQQAKKNPLKLP
jgi:hypothetical protein